MGVYKTRTKETELPGTNDVLAQTRIETFPDGTQRQIVFYPGSLYVGGSAAADTTLISPQRDTIYSPHTGYNHDKTTVGYLLGGQTISPEAWKRINIEMDKLRENMLFPAFNRR